MGISMNVIFGAGGFAREVRWLLHDLAKANSQNYAINAFVAANDAKSIGQNIQGSVVLAEDDFFEKYKTSKVNIFIAVGSPQLKRDIREKCCASLSYAQFPSLIHPSVLMDTRKAAVRIEQGSIICAGTILTTNIEIAEFSHINLGCTVGHDAIIGAYSTLSPGVHISGGVTMNQSCFVGTGAVILERVSIPPGTVIGAGATVVKTISIPGTYIGTPAIRREKP
jgi:sugar O-acyltransferase (sialic acid O-acetyltransferase NeuD family)